MSEDNASQSDMMTLEELRKRMGISQTVAYRLAAKNALPIPVIRIGRQFRCSRRAWDALVNAQHAEAEQKSSSAA